MFSKIDMIKITLNKTLAIPSIPFSFRRVENSAWERNHPCRNSKIQIIAIKNKNYGEWFQYLVNTINNSILNPKKPFIFAACEKRQSERFLKM
tara:strand:- start:315 stop:593 length:279 start_codon:yes stop_codon:yes gene_type:complete